MSALTLQLILSVVSKLPKPIRDSINMRIPPITNDPSKVQLARPAHIYVDHPNLEEFAKFAADFGIVEELRTDDCIYFRGYGKDPYCYVARRSEDGKPRFRGGAWVAQSQAEFDKAAKMEGARLGSLMGAPGGGEIVTFNRPDDTFFHVIYGQKEREAEEHEPSATHEHLGPFNKPFEKPRKGQFQRFHPGPALVHKLGHYGYVFPDFDTELAWYTTNFNFVPSDILHHWDFDNVDVMTFLHLDLGEDFSDHHCLFIQRAEPHVKKAFCHHTSFEVADVDTQIIGHQWLASKKWHSVWGVGRHVLGSQIFDYWADPSGFKIEHYADGDVVNMHTVTKREVVGPFSIWGPEMPKDFGEKIPEAFRHVQRDGGGFISRWLGSK